MSIVLEALKGATVSCGAAVMCGCSVVLFYVLCGAARPCCSQLDTLEVVVVDGWS